MGVQIREQHGLKSGGFAKSAGSVVHRSRSENQIQLGNRGVRPAVQGGKSPEPDERSRDAVREQDILPAVLTCESTARNGRPLGPVGAQEHLVITNLAVAIPVLSRKVADAMKVSRFIEFERDLVRVPAAITRPPGMPHRVRIPVDGEGTLVVRFLSQRRDPSNARLLDRGEVAEESADIV